MSLDELPEKTRHKAYIEYARERCVPSRKSELEAFIKLMKKEGNESKGIAAGLPYRVWRHYSGHWNGYVGIYHGHPYYGLHYDECAGITVHGGLTFAETMDEWGYPDMWWLGFDTAHACDLTLFSFWQETSGFGSEFRDVYRTKQYVTKQCRLLALQLDQIKPIDGHLRELIKNRAPG